MSGAVPPWTARPLSRAARVPRPCQWFPGAVGVGVGTQQCALLRAVVARCKGGGRASPGGVPRAVVRGVRFQALSLPRLPVLWGGCRGPLPTCCGRVCAGVGAQHCFLGLKCPVGGSVPQGWWVALPARVAFHRCQGRLVSGAVRPPAARPSGCGAGVARPVYPRRGWCGLGDPAPVSQRALLRAAVERCGSGGRVPPGGVPFAVVRGV